MDLFDGRRRRLLQLAGVSPAIALMGPVCAQQSGGSGMNAEGQPMPARVRLPSAPQEKGRSDSVGVAIVGLGGFALNQMMPSFARAGRAHIAGLVSGNAEKAKRVGDAYGVPEDARYSYETFDQIASDERIEAVYIVLPNGLHADWTEKAFAAGKHVLCEKPMALSSEECERMMAAARAADRKLMVAYRCHFEPYNLKAMALMDDEAVGAIRLIRTEQHYVMGPTSPRENWRANRALAGRGPLEDYGIYGLQSALYLSNEMPHTIQAYTQQPDNDPRFEDIVASVQTQMQFPSGAVAQLSTSYDTQGANRVMVQGRAGTLEMDPATSYEGIQMSLRRGRSVEALNPGDTGTQFAAQLDHFADAIRDNVDLRTPGAMGLRDIRLIEAIYAAAETGAPVALLPDGRMKPGGG